MIIPEFYPERIPTELAGRRQWVTACPAKIPHNPHSGLRASPTNRVDWGTFEEATVAARQRGHRVGFCLTDDDPFTLIDLDRCRSAESGELEPWAANIIEQFPGTYMEISASKTGIHILGLTTRPLPPNGRKRGRIEMYTDRRYVMLTGDTIPGHERLGDITEAALKFHTEVFPPAPPRPPQTSTGGSPTGATIEDDALIERARNAANGGKFNQLWSGDTSGYGGDDSAADLALTNILAFWTQGDPTRIDQLFRQSRLMREKWDQRRGGQTYGEITVAKAAADCQEFYTLPTRATVRANSHLASFGSDAEDALPDDLTQLKLIVLDLRVEVADLRNQVNEEQRARVDAESRADRSAKLQSRTAGILGNPHLGQERVVAVALSHEFAYRESAGDTGTDGLYRVPLARIAERTGVCKETASRGIKRLEALGALSRRLVMVPESTDAETGEITPMHRELFVGPTTDALSFAETVATIVPEAPKPKWGGALNRCPDHPDAKIIRRTTWECAAPGCGHILGETISGPMKHPATEADDPKRQDACFATDDPNSQDASLVPDDPESAEHSSAVVNVRSSNISAEWFPPAHEWESGATSAPPLPDEPDPVDFGDDDHFGAEVFVWTG
jgi:hypothetical protein